MLVLLTSLLPLALADWTGNLNFRSPSDSHSLGIALPRVLKRQSSDEHYDPEALIFTHGVASGDPYADSVILWTRVAPTAETDRSNVTVSGTVPLYNHGMEEYALRSQNPICVDYLVSTDSPPTSDNSISAGRAYTSSDIDFTVKVEATGLQAWIQYYYRFEVCGSGNTSPVGRTKTTPQVDDEVTAVSLGVFSCADYSRGFFNSYGNAARKNDIDYVIHLGDYIYEFDATSDERPAQPPKELYSLYDYRKRIATYRTDEDLLLSHAQYAWITTWDDHEVADNAYRDGSSFLNNTEDSFELSGGVSVDQRKMNAVRAYFEWMPIRQVDMDDNLRIWRSFSIGNLIDLIILDTRHYDRSIPPLFGRGNDEYIAQIENDASRTLMGSAQENWFYDQLVSSKRRGAQWRIIGNQIIFSNIDSKSQPFDPVDDDAWDGYRANRNRTLKTIYDNKIDNTIMLSGDSHANWVADLTWVDGPDVPAYSSADGSGAVGVEFAGTAISAQSIVCSSFSDAGPASLSIPDCNEVGQRLIEENGVLQWQEGYYRGYYELHISSSSLEAQYFGTPTVAASSGYEVSLANFTVVSGANRISRPVGSVENGAVRDGTVRLSNLTIDTRDPGRGYFIHDERQMYLEVESTFGA